MILLPFILIFFSMVLLGYIILTSLNLNPYGRRSRQKKSRIDSFTLESHQYENSFIFVTPAQLKEKSQSAMMLMGCLGCLGFFTGWIPGIFLTVAFGTAGYFLLTILLKMQIAKRLSQFNSQILDLLETVSNGLKAGLSFIQALESAAAQLSDPMKQELQYTLRQNSLGVNLDDAMISMCERMKSDNFNLVVSAITVTRQLGGNLPEIFKIISETIRDRETMEGKIAALTSQGKMQAMLMSAMPFVLMLGIFVLDKKTIMPLFTNPIGWGLLVLLLILNGLGFIFIRKIVNIDI